MPTYRLTVEKYMAALNEYWTNVYHVNAESGANTVPITDALVAAERQILSTQAIITKVSITLPGDGSGAVFGANTYNLAGLLNTPNLVPLFVVARVDFTVGGSRPSRKYLRAALDEGLMTHTTIDGSYLAVLNTYAAAIVAVSGICDVDGQAIVAGSTKPSPAMRQLRRGSKKKLTPSTPG